MTCKSLPYAIFSLKPLCTFSINSPGEIVDTKDIFEYKNQVHKRQLYALYVVNQITQIANKRR
jgi:hypothetical protein